MVATLILFLLINGYFIISFARALDIKGRSLIERSLYSLVNSLKAKNHYGGNTNLISFNKWLFHYILCVFSYGFEMQLGGALEISPRVLVVLKPALRGGLPVAILLHNS